MNKEYQLKNLQDTQKLAKELAGEVKGGQVIGLVGDLGAGKTTFVQFLAKELGIKEEVKSPTFVLMKKYQIPDTRYSILDFVHVDAYRLESPEELENIGLTEYIGQENTLVVIEWADKVKEILPDEAVMMEFEEGEGEGERRVKIISN